MKTEETPQGDADDKRSPTIFARNRARRAAQVKPLGDVRLSAETKASIIEMVAQGAMITEIAEAGILPTYHHMWNECRRDPDFEAEYKLAQAKGARVLLNAANEHAQEMLESGDIEQVRAAESFMRITESFVEKVAPKEFGQLVKLAGDPDAPLAVQVINFALPPAKPLEVIDIDDEELRAIPANGGQARARGGTLEQNEENQAATSSISA